MTPEQLEAIRERATGRPDGGMKTGPSSSWRQATNDRAALLAYVEKMEKRLAAVLDDHDRYVRQDAHLLAHQQARAERLRAAFVEVCEDRVRWVGLHSKAESEFTTLRAENERLRALLKEAHTGLTHGGGSCAACGAEPGCDIDCPVCRWTYATETALGNEREGGAA